MVFQLLRVAHLLHLKSNELSYHYRPSDKKGIIMWVPKRKTVWRSTGQGGGDAGGGNGGSGGGEAGGGENGSGGSGGGDGGGNKGERTLSQAEVNRIATKEKQEGHNAGRAALLKELGIDNPEKAKEMIDAAKKAEDDALNETQKAQRKAEADKVEAENDRKEAKLEKLNARIERRLLAEGLSLAKDDDKADKQLARAVRLLDLDLDSDQEAVKAAVKDLKDEMPNLFAETDDDEEDEEDDRRKPTGRTDPGRPPRKGKPKGTSKERAHKTLLERHPQLADKK